MEIPKTLKILGKEFQVVDEQGLRSDQGRSLIGQCSYSELKIKINSIFPQETQKSGLLHEVIEAINTMCELNLEHPQICVLEESLYQVLKDNKLHF